MFHDFLNMGWPAGVFLSVCAIALVVTYGIRQENKRTSN